MRLVDGAYEVLDELDLVGLALAREALQRLADRDVLAPERLVGLDVLAHALLDGRQVGVGQGDAVGELEVVVEAVGDRRADRDPHPGIELHDRRGEHVRGVVADELERLRRALRDDLQLRAVRERGAEVAQLPVDLDGQRRPRQTGADGRRRVRAGRALVEVETGPVRKRDVHHAAL
jgi:hypothetical protein